MVHITDSERRLRIGRRHLLIDRSSSPLASAAALVGLHSSDPATVYLSAWARESHPEIASMDDALFGARSLVRVVGMRKTLFVAPRHLAGAMGVACARQYHTTEKNRFNRMLADNGIQDETWVDRQRDALLEALANGPMTARALARSIPDLDRQLTVGTGTKWETTVGANTRLLFLMTVEGLVVRAQPTGGWTSGQYSWARTDLWLGESLGAPKEKEARAVLIEAWLRTYGPGTLLDLCWWGGWSQTKVRKTLEQIGAEAVTLEDSAGWILEDDAGPSEAVPDWVAFLPSLDPSVMGWKDRSFYLGPHQELVFDRNGNAGATVLHNGRIVGGWAQTREGRVAFELLEDIGSTGRDMVEQRAGELEAYLGPTRVKPRFPAEVDRRLAR